jgi:hypothetical protein
MRYVSTFIVLPFQNKCPYKNRAPPSLSFRALLFLLYSHENLIERTLLLLQPAKITDPFFGSHKKVRFVLPKKSPPWPTSMEHFSWKVYGRKTKVCLLALFKQMAKLAKLRLPNDSSERSSPAYICAQSCISPCSLGRMHSLSLAILASFQICRMQLSSSHEISSSSP